MFHGCGGFAGEIGHTCVVPDGLPCACGNSGCLEAYLKKEAVEAQFGPFRADDVLEGTRPEILGYYVRHLGTALCNAVNLLDPDSICLYLPDNRRQDVLLQPLAAYLEAHAVICQSHRVDLVGSSIPYSTPAAAAVSPLLTRFFRQGGSLPEHSVS